MLALGLGCSDEGAHLGYDDGVLRITPVSNPPGLAIAGEIDEDTYSALVRMLGELAGLAEIHLNLAGVTYCDLAGLRAIIRLARAGPGRRLVLHDVPPSMRTVLSIVGWDATPGLVIDQGASAPPG
jgi:ABC-type transporter Mla MlaB component